MIILDRNVKKNPSDSQLSKMTEDESQLSIVLSDESSKESGSAKYAVSRPEIVRGSSSLISPKTDSIASSLRNEGQSSSSGINAFIH